MRLATYGGLEAWFGSVVWRRGLDYFFDRKVQALRADADQQGFEAEVRGTAPEAYAVSFRVHDAANGSRFAGTCTCPAAKPCKHIAAVAWLALDELGLEYWLDGDSAAARRVQEVDAWVARLRQDGARRRGARRKAPRRKLMFVLQREDDDDNPRAVLVPMAVNLRRDGTFGAPRRCDMGDAWYAQPSWVGEDDHVLWFRLGRLRGGAVEGTGRRVPATADGTAVLHAFIETGRVYWEHVGDTPVVLGQPRVARFAWRLGPDGTQRLAVDCDDDEALTVLPLAPLHYYDRGAGALGPFDVGLPDTIALAMLEAPEVLPGTPPEALRSLTAALREQGVPPPATLSVVESPRVVPVPVLTLHAVDGEAQGRLAFDYSGAIVPASARSEVASRREGDALFRFRRDRSRERAARDQLAEVGLRRTSNEGTWLVDDGPAGLGVLVAARPRLESAGWRVNVEAELGLELVEPDDWYLDLERGESGWFTFEIGVEIDGERVNVLPAIVEAIGSGQLAGDRLQATDAPFILKISGGRSLVVDAARLDTMLGALVELFGERPLFDGRAKMAEVDVGRLTDLDGYRWDGDPRLRDLAERLRGAAPPRVELPPGLRAELRDYQRGGLDWLQFLGELELGGILADDMGLGKTVQLLAHLLADRQSGRASGPSLVVAPRSVLRNWEREAQRFAPELRVAIFHGTRRAEELGRSDDLDLVITTYALLQRDESLRARRWHLCVLDEAQAVKNPKAKVRRAAAELDAAQKLCLTGTPMENNLGELWSLVDFVLPGFLGDERTFNAEYRTPIERDGSTSRLAALSRRIAPFVLRRVKRDVLAELPPKTQVILHAQLTGAQRDLYESVRLAMDKRVRDALKARGLARSRIVVLDALLKLRQVCCHPPLVKLERAQGIKDSSKLDLLRELLASLHDAGRRVLVFSQFTSMLDAIGPLADELGIGFLRITGKTRKRQEVVDRFQRGDVPLLLVSLRAGGTGLNLTAADTVIHYDPWWNPAVERQATDRAHRIGQRNPITVYRLVCEGSVEERILALQARKQALADAIQTGAEQRSAAGLKLDDTDLETLLAPLTASAASGAED